ncbi:unnamed protein product, partial [marine sediment metagenome]
MSKPKIAIITRTKNRPLFLERAVNSVLNQNFENFMHVIVNDGGETDPVDKLALKYKDLYNDRLKIVHNDVSKGMEAASN